MRLEHMSVKELREVARRLGVMYVSERRRSELIEAIPRTGQWCEVCHGKWFVNPDGTPNNAFEGSVIPCPKCNRQPEGFTP